MTPHREKELKHDEEKIGEIINDIPYELLSEMKYGDDNMIIEAMKQYAEHIMKSEINKVLEGVDRLLIGVNKTENEHPRGWWETSTGAEFGEKILQEVNKLRQ